MNDSWEAYRGIRQHFGEEWLKNTNNQTHPLFEILFRNNEKAFLKDLDKYLKEFDTKKSITEQLRNNGQFWDIYYELEIAYFLKQIGLRPKLHDTVQGNETDILLEEQNLDLEITHMQIPYKKSPVIDPKETKFSDSQGYNLPSVIVEKMESYFEKEKFQNRHPNIVLYPIIVCFCTDIAGVDREDCYDLRKLLENKNCIPDQVCALAIWKNQSILCLYENTHGKKLDWKSDELQKFFNPKTLEP